MKTISKSVLQLTRQIIREDDDDRDIIRMLRQARNNIRWELESDAYGPGGTNYKYVLRYVPERKKWAVYEIYADTGEAKLNPRQWDYYKKYENALRTFNRENEWDGVDPAKTKRTKSIFGTQ